MLRALLVAGAGLLVGSSPKNNETTPDLLKGMRDAADAMETLRPHVDSIQALLESREKLQKEADKTFKSGTYTADQADEMLKNMAAFSKKAQDEMAPLVEKVKNTAPSDKEIKSTTNRIKQGLAPLGTLKETLDKEEEISNTHLDALKTAKPALKNLPLEKRRKLHINAQKKYLAALQEIHAIKGKGDFFGGMKLILEASRLAGNVNTTTLLPSEETAEIKELQKKIDPFVKQMREDFQKSKQNAEKLEQDLEKFKKAREKSQKDPKKPQQTAPQTTQPTESPRHQELRRRM